MSQLPRQVPADPLMQIAWRDCLMWSVGNTDIIRQFTADTGIVLSPARTPLDRMIDRATGFDLMFAERYIDWFNANVWGLNAAGLPVDAGDPGPADAGLER